MPGAARTRRLSSDIPAPHPTSGPDAEKRTSASGSSPALKHYGRSKTALVPLLPAKVAELKAFLEEHGSRWMTRADEPLILNTARNLLIADQIWSYLEPRGFMDSYGRPRAVAKQWFTLQNALTRQLSALGCSPLARAELGANLAASKLDAAQAMRFARPRAANPPAASVDTGDAPE